ncbi:MAG TPA: ABC transporter permease, partial [Oxalicibacterium sp.]|nr:ABC transporter permease [Oxalicibacterium sp.]
MVAQEAPPLIELHNIRKQYGGAGGAPAVEVLHGLSLQIRAGEFVAIVGTSGSGKSTLMHLLGCLDRPSSGRYLFNGRDVATLDGDELAWLRREAFGFVFQGYHLIATESARENVEVPAIYAGMTEAKRAERAAALLTRLGLHDKLENRSNQLSGGQQQRVSIARALMNGGRIILADEPTGALDSKSGTEVMALLHELADAGHTIILITHDRDVAAQARRVIEIRDGSIVGDSGTQSHTNNALPAPQMEEAGRDPEGATWRAELREAARTAWRGMRMNRVRTGLTLLGIVIGVASVIVMLAVGEGAKQRVIDEMGSLGTTIMYLGSGHPSNGGPPGRLTMDDLDAVAALPQIGHVMPIIGDPVTVRYGNVDRQVYVFASAAVMPQVHRWRVARGRFFTKQEDRGLAPVAVIGHKAWQNFFPDGSDPIGKQILIVDAPFEVIGVMAARGADSGSQDYDEMIFIPYDSGRMRVYDARAEPDYTVVEAASEEVVQEAEQAMKDLLVARRGRDDFRIGNAAAKLQAAAQTSNAMKMMLGLIAAVSLVVGGIGVMNVMLMTVRERTREIGIRVATGARQRDILRQFLTEAVLVSVVGGAIGVLGGLAIGAVLLLSGVPVIFSVTAIVGAFACSLATGLIFGYMPAKKAAAL